MKRIFLLALCAMALAGSAKADLTVHQKIAAYDRGITEAFEILTEPKLDTQQELEGLRESAVFDSCGTEQDISEYINRAISSMGVALDRAKKRVVAERGSRPMTDAPETLYDIRDYLERHADAEYDFRK
jgi:hypothetical protein